MSKEEILRSKMVECIKHDNTDWTEQFCAQKVEDFFTLEDPGLGACFLSAMQDFANQQVREYKERLKESVRSDFSIKMGDTDKIIKLINSEQLKTLPNDTTQITTCAGRFVNGLCNRCGQPPFTTGNFDTCGRWINPPYIDYKQFEGKDLHTVTPESSERQEKNSPYICPIDNTPCFGSSNCIHSDTYPALCGNEAKKLKPVESSEPQEKGVFQKALERVPQSVKDQVDWDHQAIKEAWEMWEEDQKSNPSSVNPHAFAYGFVAAKKKYQSVPPSETQEEMWTSLKNMIWCSGFEVVKEKFAITRK